MASTTIPNLTHLKIPLEDVVKATNNFHHDNIIGHGDFGTAYKGQLLRSGNLINIAVRRLDRKHGVGVVEFWNEVRVLSDLNHKNLVSIIGFCYEEHEKIIITTYEANGSLGQFLDNMNLTWTQRLRISIGVAKALSYLHYDEGRGYVLIHNFINCSTILLDGNWEAKLSGFEFSIKQPVNQRDHITLSDLVGATGYIDPAVEKTRGVTPKSDTYSFGVVLFEMLCGRKTFIQNDGDTLLAPLVIHHYKNNTLKGMIHPDIFIQMSPKSLNKYLKVAYACLTEERARRPDTNDIVRKLEKALEFHLRFENLGKHHETLMIASSDIKLATDNFSETYKIQDWDGCALYKAEFDHFKNCHSYVEGKNQGEYLNGYNTVIINRYPQDGEEDFTTNFEMLNTVKHHNIISLLGFCVDGSEMILVIENPSKGFLNSYLRKMDLYKHIFSWEKRLKICIDVAHALRYIHYEMENQKTIINRDIFSGNIALDENWRAKIFAFGSAVFLPPNQEEEALYLDWWGRDFYIDPQYKKTLKLKRESDVYSFGVVMFEILCGRSANNRIYQRESDIGLADVARKSFQEGTVVEMIDPIILKETDNDNLDPDRGPENDSLSMFIKIALQCVAETQDQRPTMKVVVEELEKALFFHEEKIQSSNTDQDANKHGKFKLIRGILAPRRDREMLMIPLSDIKSATESFSETYKIQDRGCYTLYKAEFDRFKKNHSHGEYPKGYNTVVIKRYHHGDHMYRKKEFTVEYEMLTSVVHHNIASLLGICVDGSEMILVIENAFMGFLNNYLKNVKLYKHIFTWEKRLKICIDVAHALCYLHYEMEDKKMIINRDICSGNIALDEDWRAEIFDFGSAVFLPPNQEDEAFYHKWRGRDYYTDPQYKKTNKLDTELDVYGFGVVLFEMLCGKVAYDEIYLRESDMGLAHVARQIIHKGTPEDMIDPIMKEETGDNSLVIDRGPNKHSLNTFLRIAYACVAKTQDQRPTMKVVVEELEKALSFQDRRIQRKDKEQVVNKHEKPWLARKTPEMDLEHLKIRLRDIKSATDDFSQTQIIADWEEHTLYKAKLKYFEKQYHSYVEENNNNGEHPKGHNTIVIKRYSKGHDVYGKEQFYKEIESLTSVNHSNIATLHGFCVEDSEMILIINDVSNGYLSEYLENVDLMCDLTWEKRLKICFDVANALKYLHSEIKDGKMILNNVMYTYNIGLDENWGAKVIDFADFVSLPSNLDDKAHKSSDFNEISNICEFGEILFEILCGRANDPNYKRKRDTLLGYVATPELCSETIHDIVDPMLMNETNESRLFLDKGPNMDSLNTFIEITRRCLADDEYQRPTMEVVVKQLEEALLFQKNHKGNKRVSLEDIRRATDNFHDDNYVGGGGFGKAYKGDLKDGDRFKTIVAKRLDRRFGQGERQFLSELQILWEYKHENIIGLEGYCDENQEKIIVYEYAPRKSLNKYLDNTSLTWVKRLNICIDVASALDFLHGGVGKQAKVIHRDIKTENILLNNDWKAKLADFGLSLISSLTQEGDYIIDHWCGTPGYVDPVYKKSKVLTIESDIYSFGVVLFEILYGRSTYAIHKHEGHHLSEFIKKIFDEGKQDEVVFEKIREEIVPESLTTFQKIAYQCLQQEREKRPATKEVLIELKKALELQVGLTELKKALEFQEIDLEHLKIRLRDIKFATDNFSQTQIIADWELYTSYTAELKYFEKQYHSSVEENNNNGEHPKGHNTVVIKRYPKGHDVLIIFKEIELLTSVNHSNIATLHGFCVEDSEMILVINGVSNGYLNMYLENVDLMCDLTWEKRLKICVDVANALKYIHSEIKDGKMILNDFICTYNIGLDENWGAKIIDFADFVSLPSNLDEKAHKSSDFNEISNVCEFGEILFEVLCGRADDPNYERKRDTLLGYVATPDLCSETIQEIVDPMIMNETNESCFFLDKGPNMDSVNTFIEITRRCLADDEYLRPTMEVVVKQLEEALLFQKNHKGNKRVSLDDIIRVTNNFHDSNCIGRGGFGKAYKGDLKDGDRFKTIVAKRLDENSVQGGRQFLSELQILWEYKHENIIGLEGYCDENQEKIIVYEYAPRKSLNKYLDQTSLTWVKRLNICVDVASALDYLHGGVGEQAKVIHRDIKIENILLNNDWKAKLADFGLSLISSLTQESDYIIDHWCGTPGYVDPAYKKSKVLTIESDIYSFGVVLFEILCGRSTYAIHKHEGHHLPEFVKKRFDEGKQDEVVFEKIREQIVPESLTTFQKIAYQCLQQEREKRPATKEVLTELKKALEFQVVLTELKKALEFQLNSEVKSNYVEKSHASITGKASNIDIP